MIIDDICGPNAIHYLFKNKLPPNLVNIPEPIQIYNQLKAGCAITKRGFIGPEMMDYLSSEGVTNGRAKFYIHSTQTFDWKKIKSAIDRMEPVLINYHIPEDLASVMLSITGRPMMFHYMITTHRADGLVFNRNDWPHIPRVAISEKFYKNNRWWNNPFFITSAFIIDKVRMVYGENITQKRHSYIRRLWNLRNQLKVWR